MTRSLPRGGDATPAVRRYVPLPNALRHGLTLAWRKLLKTRKNPESLIDVTIQPVLFMVIFVFLLGGAISGNWRNYLQFVLPGLMVQNVMQASIATGISLNVDITKGVFDRFRSLPIARSAPLVGAVLGDIVRYVVALTILIVFAVILGFRVHTDPLSFVAAFALMVAFGLCMCWISVLAGMLVTSTAAVQGVLIPFVLLFSFGSNVFAQATTMPGWLRAWVDVNPVSKLVDATRGLLLGGPVAGPLLAALAWMVGIVAVFFPLAVRAYARRIG